MISVEKVVLKNGHQISYELDRKKVKNINFRIKPDQKIYVSANSRVSIKTINDFIISKTDYIENALQKYEERIKYAPKPKQYVDGETFHILGREIRLKVNVGTKNSISCDDAFIYLTVKNTDDFNLKKRIVDNWQKKLCNSVITEICKQVFPKFQKYGIEFPELRFRAMVSRWGSCQPKRKVLTFNYALLETPVYCIEYVVVHEFTHFLQPNHSKLFYNQLSMFMPDWKQRKKTLEKNWIYLE